MDKMTNWIAVLLKTARAAYVVAATACILVAVLGSVVALYFQLVMVIGPSHVFVPPVPMLAAPAISVDAVDDRLKPPMNVRVNITHPVIDKPLSSQNILGYFQADTANGLARFPEDVDILGGKDSDLFDRRESASQIPGQGAALIPTKKLVEQVNNALQKAEKQQRYDFALVVVARDAYGVPSQVTDVAFTLAFGQGLTAPTEVASSRQAEPPIGARQMSDLERLAQDIALIVDREGSPAYVSAYNRALRQPNVCGTSQSDSNFVVNYRRLFDHARPRLAVINLQAFFDGVCDAWRRATAEQAKTRAAAETDRNAAIAANQSAQFQYQFEAAAAWAARNLTLIVVGSALGAFLMLCLVLAFLAMEKHSNAMRDALVALSESRRREQQP